jgi:aspartyl-tRNA(Asn)/glutamyl-tRNA(Gln) amidotransferase subunit B
MSKYQSAIGLEVHVQLKTRSKMFCGCSTEFGRPPNTQVCPVCLGYPGALPVMNGDAIRLTVLAGLMLGSRISPCSKFDRKNYFYPDMPKNYQISQYDRPLCEGGAVEAEVEGRRVKTIRLTRIHLEEDVGKNMHFGSWSGVDFNRAGVPLMEVVSEPDMESPEEAFAYLLALKQILTYGGVSDCNLEQGNLRCDVNCSVRPAGQTQLGTKTEIKNLNTFKGVSHALKHEIARQIEALEAGGRIVQETRRWDAEAGVTAAMRSKEEAHDYRYFPEPDLMPVALPPAVVAQWAAGLPELPRQRRERFGRDYGLPDYDAQVLVADKAVGDYYEAVVRHSPYPKTVSNWVMTEVLRMLSERDMDIRAFPISAEALAELVKLAETGVINSNTAKEVFGAMLTTGATAGAIVAERGLAQVSDAGFIASAVAQALAENPKSVDDYRKGKTAALKFLVGQVMRRTQGKANPAMVTALLERTLGVGGP